MLGIFDFLFKKKRERLKRINRELEEKIASLENSVKDLAANLTSKDETISKLETDSIKKDSTISDLNQESQKKDNIIQESKEKFQKLERESAKRINELEEKNNALEISVKDKSEDLTKKDKVISRLENDSRKKDSEISELNQEKQKKDLEISNLNQEAQKKDSVIQESKENIQRLEQEKAKCINEIEEKNKALDSKEERLQFVARVINSTPEKNQAYEKFLNLLNNDYMAFANENDSLAAEAEALVKLQNVSNQLEFLSYDNTLLNKSIVAIAGSFSSGKSSFMNSFFKTREIKLPTGMDQTTAISSYVMNGNESIVGYSYKGGKIDIPNEMFKLFSYKHIEEFSFNMKQIINHIVFRTEFVEELNDMCFIDTPGFNPGQEAQSDYDAATSAIATANSMIWCVDIHSGTIQEDELEILQDIFYKNEKLGIYIVLNKADLKPMDENQNIMEEIESQLKERGIPIKGISLYTSAEPFSDQPKEYSACIGFSLSDFLEKNNVENKQKEKTLLKKVDEVFDEYKNADSSRIKKTKARIKMLRRLENSFSSINDSKDEQIAYYKARMDRERYRGKNFDDSTEKDEALFDNLADLKKDLTQMVKKDEEDMEKADELCFNMKSAVAEVFGHKLRKVSNGGASRK